MMTERAENAGTWPGNRWRIAAWTGAALILLLPLIAMQFTDEVVWTVSDFVFAGVLIAITGGTYELTVRKTGSGAYRSAVGVALAAAFILVWANGAVGVIGDEGNAANLMYGGVLAVGVIGALIARFRARGMARALVATALAQVLVPVIAVWADVGTTASVPPGEIVMVTGFFTALWVGAAVLFRNAAQEQPPAGAVVDSG